MNAATGSRAGRARRAFAVIVLAAASAACLAQSAPSLPSYRARADDVSVSGISSGAYMAIQFGTAFSAQVTGVGATAGGPYYCAATDASKDFNLRRVIRRCMQGDPAYGKDPITNDWMQKLYTATQNFAAAGKIDKLDNLKRQKIWLFHGYNDGIVKQPVMDRLYEYYSHYVPPQQIFYKSGLNAGHAQISASCASQSGACNTCPTTGGNFINQCQDRPAALGTYDAVGAMLQHIYGALHPPAAPGGQIVAFRQDEFTRSNRGHDYPGLISMSDTGYAYVPAHCSTNAGCRVHIAFHGCMQSADALDDFFYRNAGYNEWADQNAIIVLYPQTTAKLPSVVTPLNPMGCWDWWGYNDLFDSEGRYATKAGLQVAAVKAMLDRLTQGGPAAPAAAPLPAFGTPAGFAAADANHTQIALRWQGVTGAAGYILQRSTQPGGPYATAISTTATQWVDRGLQAGQTYYYILQAKAADGTRSAPSAELSRATGPAPPPCDPYFSLAANRPVTRNNLPTSATCD
ncbi:MAG: hypothetical protein JNJ60_05740 [Rhodocyclaceae bacterium]|nr:hypothetical protein [Rhodocyclaceae bacterium]